MSLSRDQIILLKRAQQQAGIPDAEYRDTIGTVSGFDGCNSSTDVRLSDRVLDKLMAYFEAIYWRRHHAGELPAPDFSKRTPPVFQVPGYWADKNQNGNTSRDRYAATDLSAQIRAAEADLRIMGYGYRYLEAIRRKVPVPRNYLAALKRTINSKQHGTPKSKIDNEPF